MQSRHKITVNVVGVNGRRFCISGPGAGADGVWLNPEHVGLLDTPVETIWASTQAQIGASFAGAVFNARDLSLPVTLLDTADRPWQTVDSHWRKAWSYTEDSQLEVITPGSGKRVLKCRLSATPEYDTKQLSGQQQGSHKMLMHLKAGDPLWYEESETDLFVFDGVHWSGSVEVANPTDMPMWLQWTLTGPASFILPDFSWEERPGYPGYEHQRRMITMPFQRYKLDVAVDSNPEVEQVVAFDRPSWGAKMNGQFFYYPVPPWTEPTRIPVFVNPLPWTADVWHALQIPFEIPTEFLVKLAEVLTRIMSPLGTGTVLSWTVNDLAERIDAALVEVFAFFRDRDADGDGETDTLQWIQAASKKLTKQTVGQLLAETWGHTWGSLFTMPGSGLQVRQVRRWSRPYGLE